jgi:hypothetical protein
MQASVVCIVLKIHNVYPVDSQQIILLQSVRVHHFVIYLLPLVLLDPFYVTLLMGIVILIFLYVQKGPPTNAPTPQPTSLTPLPTTRELRNDDTSGVNTLKISFMLFIITFVMVF